MQNLHLTHCCTGVCRDLADAVGLERVDPDADPRAVEAPFALYDGSQFVMNQSDWTLLTMLRMGLRYGTAPLRFDGLPQAFFKKFFGIYELQVGCASSHMFGYSLNADQVLVCYR